MKADTVKDNRKGLIARCIALFFVGFALPFVGVDGSPDEICGRNPKPNDPIERLSFSLAEKYGLIPGAKSEDSFDARVQIAESAPVRHSVFRSERTADGNAVIIHCFEHEIKANTKELKELQWFDPDDVLPELNREMGKAGSEREAGLRKAEPSAKAESSDGEGTNSAKTVWIVNVSDGVKKNVLNYRIRYGR